MPFKERACGQISFAQGMPQRPTMQRVVGSSVSVVLSQPFADLECQLRRHRHISLVEKPMKVCPQQQTVADLMWSARCEGFDMAGFECGQRVFFSDGTPFVICLRHSYAECALAEAWADQKRCSISYRAGFRDNFHRVVSLRRGELGGHLETFSPNSSTLPLRQIIFFVGLCSNRPISWVDRKFKLPF